jgi:peptidyl-prolyl cis-trans isomerase B (cyclophilin B)
MFKMLKTPSLALIGGVVFLFACSSESLDRPTEEPAATVAVEKEPEGKPIAIIETDKGEIAVELLSDLAPETVKNFIELGEVGFYNRTTFHRVLQDRMIQGGDPYSRDRDPFNDGQGTSGSFLPQEFSSHDFTRGTVAMGRKPGGTDGGSCQFFIVLKDSPEWNGQYNAFGRVVEGIEVADEISRAPLSKRDHPSMKNRPAGKQIIKRVRIEYR